MIQDSLIPNYDEEYDDIPYDLIYTSSTNIPTKNDIIGTNPTVSAESCSNETFLCMTGFYNSSKYFFLFLFLMLSFMTGILYLITIINTPK
jgi:hypothetical protein